MRALILIRLSRVTDATTSPERQLEECRAYCTQRGLTVVGIAEDLDVSGSVNALDRTGSGPWLRDRLGEFDTVVAWKLDRVGRNARHISNLVNYLQDHGKSLVCIHDQIDITTPVGRMLVYIIATLAEMEHQAMTLRNANAAQYNLRAGKYRGGPVPAGYAAVRGDDGSWRLAPDEDGLAPVIRAVVADVLGGKRVTAVVGELNRRGVPTAKDRQAVLNGREATGRQWSVSNLRRMLASPTLVGRVVHRPVEQSPDGKTYGPEQVLYGDNGKPVVMTDEPLISLADFYALQELLESRKESEPKQRRRAETTLLLRVLYCGECGRPMYRLKGGKGRVSRYRCASTQNGGSCGSGTIPEAEADATLTHTLLSFLGQVPFAEREYLPGIDHTQEIAEIDGQLASLAEAVPRFPIGSSPLNGLLAQVDTLTTRRAELASQPIVPGDYRYVATGRTFAEHWASLDSAGQNDYLRDNGVRATFRKLPGETGRFTMEFGEVLGMLSAVNPTMVGEGTWSQEAFESLMTRLIPGIQIIDRGP